MIWKIDVVRDGRWWAIYPRAQHGYDPCGGPVTQARRLAEVELMASEYLTLMTRTEVSPDDIEVVTIGLVSSLSNYRSKARVLAQSRADLKRAQTSVDAYAKAMIEELIAAKVPYRDIGELVGLTAQRVAQIHQGT